MGVKKSSSSSAASSIRVPSDPDPTPIATSNTSTDVRSAAREAQKRTASSYGRQKTILAGNSASDNAGKKTVLGG